MENYTDFSLDLTKSMQLTLDFVQSNSAAKDIDLLICIQAFVQQITLNLEHYLDPSMLSTFILIYRKTAFNISLATKYKIRVLFGY